jgi:vacuolar-type H+-ATPase subunit H
MAATKLDPGEEQIRMIREARRRRARALAMKEAGKTYQEIGDALGGITRQRAKMLVDKARAEAAG